MIEARAHIAAMAPYPMSDLTVSTDKPLVSLSQNESALPPSPRAVAAGREALAASRLYPDPDWRVLRQAIARVHGLDPDGILCGAGSMELIACLIQAYAGPGDRVLSSQYGYAFFKTATLAAGAPYATAPEENLTVSVDRLLAAVSDDTRVVCLANPGNPTGTRLPRRELVRLREGLDDRILLLVDEAYGEFAEGAEESVFDLVRAGATVVLRTFSKAYGLAGLRVGWGLFPPEVAGQTRKLINPNNVNVVSQAAAAAAMADQEYLRRVRAETVERRERFADRVRRLGLPVPRSHTNFVLIRFADAATAADRALRAQGIVMRAMAGYGLADCLRATIGNEAEMALAAEVLAAWKRGDETPC